MIVKQIEKYVILLENRSDVAAIMSVFDCFILPSYSEGFSLVLCEAQIQNVRCVASNAVPNEVLINDNCFVLGVDESSEKWAEYVLGNFEEARNKGFDGVDIKNTVREHTVIYDEKLRIKLRNGYAKKRTS